MNLVNIILFILIIIILLGFNDNYKKFNLQKLNLQKFNLQKLNFNNIFNNNINVLSDKDKQNIYLFLSEEYGDILLPKNIPYTKNNNIYYFKFNIIKNNENINIDMKFIPNSIYITKYTLFNESGHFELNNVVSNNIISNNEIEQNNDNLNNIDSDTEINSTEHMIDNLLL